MPNLFNNKYRIESTRLQNWDYSNNAAYFITICTHKMEYYFGEIINGKMELSEIGILANIFWEEIPKQFNYCYLDKFVVMPNHIHGIIVIDGNSDHDVETRLIASLPQSSPTQSSPQKTGGITKNKNPMLNNNLSRIIRWYKGRVTYESRKMHCDFTWQSRFYDHIIRDDKSHKNILQYIVNNPVNWENDKFYN